MPVDDGAFCPLPQAISHEDARRVFNDVKKEMPGLSAAAHRREAARRMGTDYDTFLTAWEKPGAPKIPGPTGGVTSSPVPPPTGGVLSREAARAKEKEVAKKYGLKPGSAEARRKAAEELGMTYDDFLAAWKGVKPKVPVPGTPPKPVPNPAGPAPKVTPVPKQVPETSDAISKFLVGKGHAADDFQIQANFGNNLYLRWNGTPGVHLDRVIKDLEDEGFQINSAGVNGLYRINRPIKRSPVGPVRNISDRRPDVEIRTKYMDDKFLDTPMSIAAELSDQMTYITKDLGDMFRGVLGRDFKEPDYFDKNPGVLAYYRPTPNGGRYITMGSRSQAKGFTDHHSGMQSSNWFSKCQHDHNSNQAAGGARNVLAHEFGHFVDDVLEHSTPFTRRAELYAELSADLGLTTAEQVEFLGRNDFTTSSLKKKISSSVSKYGASSRAEFFAEVWAEYTRAGVNARPHIKKWGTLIQDLAESAK